MIVYTALFDGYDALPPATFSDVARHVLFTDEAPTDPRGWEVHLVKRLWSTGARENRAYKLQPHDLFPGHRTLYHDANVQLLEPPSEVFDMLKRPGDDVGMRKHPRGRNTLQEFGEVARLGLVHPALLDRQLKRYEAMGLSNLMATWPVPEANVVAQAGSPRACAFFDAWWAEVRTFPRDQLSYIYAGNESKATIGLSLVPLDTYARRTRHLKPRAKRAK